MFYLTVLRVCILEGHLWVFYQCNSDRSNVTTGENMQSRLKFLENSFKINMLAPAWKCNGGGEGGGGRGVRCEKSLQKRCM